MRTDDGGVAVVRLSDSCAAMYYLFIHAVPIIIFVLTTTSSGDRNSENIESPTLVTQSNWVTRMSDRELGRKL